jgi:hypothetical protein
VVTRLFSHKDRPVHLGPYPLEKLQRMHEPAVGLTPPDRKAGMEAYLTAVSPEEYRKLKGLE